MARKGLPMGVPIKSGIAVNNFLPPVDRNGLQFVNVYNCREYPCEVIFDGMETTVVNEFSFTGFLKDVQHIPYVGKLDVNIIDPADFTECDCRCIAQIYDAYETMPRNTLQAQSSCQIPFPDQNYFLIEFDSHNSIVPLVLDSTTNVAGNIVKTETEIIVVCGIYRFVVKVDYQQNVEVMMTNNSPDDVDFTIYCYNDLLYTEFVSSTHL